MAGVADCVNHGVGVESIQYIVGIGALRPIRLAVKEAYWDSDFGESFFYWKLGKETSLEHSFYADLA